MNLQFDSTGQLIISRTQLKNEAIDIGGRDIIIGFNEPAFKISAEHTKPGFDSKLNARLVTYFLPAVEVAKKQKKRPRLVLVSGLTVALKWNASTEEEKKIMTINNNLKVDFLVTFFANFFPEVFSKVECIVAQDTTKIDDDKLLELWYLVKNQHPKEIFELTMQLARFKKPKLFNSGTLCEDAKKYLDSNNPELLNSFKYAISHVLALADVNFESNFFHNPVGYLSIGGHQERVFNAIRAFVYEALEGLGGEFFGQKIILKNNLKLIVENEVKTPPPYNGYYRKNGSRLFLDEVTYENKRGLDFYDNHKKLRFEMEYMYKNLVPKATYVRFWNEYRKKYFELKNRYREAYNLLKDF